MPGIALGECTAGDAAPWLVRPADAGRWSRIAILDWLTEQAQAGADLLVGIDFSAALPFADRGAYFPGRSDTPRDARALWHDVDSRCRDEPHLCARGYAEAHAPHFRIGAATGALFPTPTGNGRLRIVERHAVSGRPVSSFNLVGAAQVGLASLAGMRLLARLDGKLPIWPFDPVPAAGPLLVEVYTSIAARAAMPGRRGTKLRTMALLDAALGAAAIGSAPIAGGGVIDDHASDALLTAAWLRRAARRPALWQPAGLDEVRHTEGWTFGVP